MLGIKRREKEDDLAFLSLFYAWMTESKAPWPQVFFDWFGGTASRERANNSPIAVIHYQADMFAPIKDALLDYEPDRPERVERAYFQRANPTSLLYDEIETLWAPIAEKDDWSIFKAKLAEIEELRLALADDI